jgi:hypothetical protein
MPLSDFDRTYLIRNLTKYNSWRLYGCYFFGFLSGMICFAIAFIYDHFWYGILSWLVITAAFGIYVSTWGDDKDLLGETPE